MLQTSKKLNMATAWFKKTGWIYLPISFMGVVITLIHIIFCITVFIAVDNHSHSISDTLYGFFPFFISAATLLFWIAGHTTKSS